MSEINVTTIKNENADYGPNLVGYSTVTGGLRVTSDITGNLVGNVTGDLTGNVTGDLTGNVTGNVTGTITGIASTAISVTVTDESSDTDCNVLFVTEATGNLEPKSGTNLTFNSSTGQLTATSFSGDGSSLSNTGSTLSEPSSGTERIVTTSLTSGTMTSSGTGAELAFDYANNHLEFSDNTKATFGTGDDLQISHDGSNSFIDNTTGSLYLRNTANDLDIVLQTDNGSGGLTNYIECDGSTGKVELYYYGSEKIRTESTGVTVTGDVNSTSDINLKKDIEVVTSATEILNQLRGVKFTWKENDEKSVGVIAQEVEAILPELVRGEEGDKSVNYSGLIGVLIESVKELSARVEELENR